jgi:hypothetical protein
LRVIRQLDAQDPTHHLDTHLCPIRADFLGSARLASFHPGLHGMGSVEDFLLPFGLGGELAQLKKRFARFDDEAVHH